MHTLQEVLASSDLVAFNLFYSQAMDDIGKGRIPCGDNLAELKSFKAKGKKKEVSCLCAKECVCVSEGGRECVSERWREGVCE